MTHLLRATLSEALRTAWKTLVVVATLVAALATVYGVIAGTQKSSGMDVFITIPQQMFTVPADLAELVEKANTALDRYLKESE